MNTMKSKHMLAHTLRVIAIAMAALLWLDASAKTIRFKNETNDDTFTIKFPHFTSVTGLDRRPTLTEFKIKPGEHEDLYLKPYQYASKIYLPNVDWREDAGRGTPEGNKREEEILKYYSFQDPDEPEEYYSILAVDQDGYHYRFVSIADEEIGPKIFEMAEKPENNPEDGLAMIKDSNGKLGLEARSSGKGRVYHDAEQ